MIWFQAETCKKACVFLTFCVLFWSFPLIKMVEAARRLSLFFAVGWLKFCELPYPWRNVNGLKLMWQEFSGQISGQMWPSFCWSPILFGHSHMLKTQHLNLLSQTWASMAATAKHVSEIPAFSYHPIHLPQGWNIPGHLDSQRQWGRLFLHPIEQVFHGDSAALQSPSRSFSKTWLHVWRAFSNRLLPNEGVFDLLRGNNRCSVLRVFSADSPQAWNMTADSYENNCRFFNRHHFSTASFWKAPRLRRLRKYSSTPFPSGQVQFCKGNLNPKWKSMTWVDVGYTLQSDMPFVCLNLWLSWDDISFRAWVDDTPGKPVEPWKVWLANSSRIHPPPAPLVWYVLFNMIFVYV